MDPTMKSWRLPADCCKSLGSWDKEANKNKTKVGVKWGERERYPERDRGEKKWRNESGMVVHACNPRALQVEAGGLGSCCIVNYVRPFTVIKKNQQRSP